MTRHGRRWLFRRQYLHRTFKKKKTIFISRVTMVFDFFNKSLSMLNVWILTLSIKGEQMEFENTLSVIRYIVTFLAAAVPSIAIIVANLKKLKKAMSDAETAEAQSALKDEAVKLIVQAEELYSGVDAALKAQNQSAGALKKDSVMAKLQAYAIDNGYNFNETEASEMVDELVDMTRKVN